MLTNHQKNIAVIIHLSTFSRFLIPLGSLLGPLVLWLLNKEKSEFIDRHGKRAINFRLSIYLYSFILVLLSLPFILFSVFKGFSFNPTLHFNFSSINVSPFLFIGGLGLLSIIAFLFEVVCVILASIRAKDGQPYQYPLTISFMK